MLPSSHVYKLILITLKNLGNPLLLFLYFILKILKLRIAIKCHWIFLVLKCFALTFLIRGNFIIILNLVQILYVRQYFFNTFIIFKYIFDFIKIWLILRFRFNIFYFFFVHMIILIFDLNDILFIFIDDSLYYMKSIFFCLLAHFSSVQFAFIKSPYFFSA